MRLALATVSDAQAVSDLLNIAYRGEGGWTTESSIITGDRSSVADAQCAIKNSIVLIHKNIHQLVACIFLEKKGRETYIGSFAVHPEYQASGLGKSLLTLAESYAINHLEAERLIMVVVSARIELIAFYERRGYKRTGISEQYPQNLNVGVPKSSGLMVEELHKHVFRR